MANPLFLNRCLSYNIQEKRKKRIQMTVSIPRSVTERKNIFPMYICLARRVSSNGTSTDSAVYDIGRIFIFRNYPGIDLNAEVRANFTLPEMNKLAKEARSGTLDVLFVSTVTVEASNLSPEVNSNLPLSDPSHLPLGEFGECCLLGKLSLESLYMAWNYFPSFRLGQRAEFCTSVELFPCIMKSDFRSEYARVSVQVPSNFDMSLSKEIPVAFSAGEFGAKEKSSEPLMDQQ